MADTETIENDPTIIGSLTTEAQTMLAQFQHHAREITFQIGALEVRKTEMISQLQDTNDQARAMLQGEAARLGIKPEQNWQVLPDGRIRLVG